VACSIGTMTSGQFETITVEAVAIRTGRAINAARVATPRDRAPSDNDDAALMTRPNNAAWPRGRPAHRA
jgi:hypothetical protein